MNWPEEIAKLALVKAAMAQADQRSLFPQHHPSVAATSRMLVDAEAILNINLDKQYADFLLYANGWRGFFQTVDLFGTHDLIGSKKMASAIELTAAIEANVLASTGVTRSQILPIAATSQDMDLFTLTLPNAPNPGEVLWFAGQLIERFSNFNEYFLAMVDYNRLDLRQLRQ